MLYFPVKERGKGQWNMEKSNSVKPIIDEEPMEAEGRLLPAIVPTRAEQWGVPASAVIAYIYVVAAYSGEHWTKWIVLFAALLCGGVELSARRVPRRGESWVWLGCLWTVLLCGALGRARAWEGWFPLIVHGFGAYWVIVRSGHLLEAGGSSRYLPADALFGAVLVPLRHFFLRLRVLKASGRRDSGRRFTPAAMVGVVAAAIIALFLLGVSMALLAEADPNFQQLSDGIWNALRGFDARLAIYFLLSLPVGAYLYGMVFGTRREASVGDFRKRLDAGIGALRQVPGGAWPVLLGLFVALYAVFFAVQGSYLFDGLRGLLPERFTAAQYARRGFFELCGVMAVNFTLLGAAAVSAEGGLRAHAAARRTGMALMAESGLLAVTAAAKLALYVHRFGFTPLRLQSCWLVLVLFMGSLAALHALWTGRDMTKAWLIASAVLLALTHLW